MRVSAFYVSTLRIRSVATWHDRYEGGYRNLKLLVAAVLGRRGRDDEDGVESGATVQPHDSHRLPPWIVRIVLGRAQARCLFGQSGSQPWLRVHTSRRHYKGLQNVVPIRCIRLSAPSHRR
jgi:hypothetical protein